jgi:hypothetical protein
VKHNKTKNQLQKNNCKSRAAGTQRKRRESSTSKKHPETSSYKVQLLHALILTQTIAESGRPRGADLVVALHNLRQLSRMTTEIEQQIQHQKTSPNFILQGAESARFDSDADHRRERPPPRRRLGCLPAQLTSALTHDDAKNSKFSSKKHPQTSSYKGQNLHALILTQTIAESGRPRGADLVVALHNLRQLSRMTTEKEQQIQHQKTSPNFILQGPESARFDSDADHRRERPPPRRRLGCGAAQLTSALTHDDGKRTANSAAKYRINLTRFSVFTLLISPVFMRAANAVQSAAETSK